MSMDERSICPRCHYEAKEKMKNGYGELTEEEYIELKEKLDNPYKLENYGTLEERYELGTYENHGKIVVEISYHATCGECGLEVTEGLNKTIEELKGAKE